MALSSQLPVSGVVLPVQQWQTQDVDAHAQALPGWAMRYDQLTPGRFVGALSEWRLDGLQLTWERTNQSLRKSGQAWPGAITLSLVLAEGVGEAYCAGHVLRPHGLLIAHGKDLPELRTPAGLELLCISVDAERLGALLEQQQIPWRGSSQATSVLLGAPLAQRCQAVWQRWCQDGFAGLALAPEAAPGVAALSDTVWQAVLDLGEGAGPVALSPTAQRRLVERACRYALRQQETPPSMLELCNAVGASRRKLQYCFQATLGINPVRYLRILRLNAVRRRLRAGGADCSVQAAAAEWGFWHLSHFAREYRGLFGELPSETLARVA